MVAFTRTVTKKVIVRSFTIITFGVCFNLDFGFLCGVEVLRIHSKACKRMFEVLDIISGRCLVVYCSNLTRVIPVATEKLHVFIALNNVYVSFCKARRMQIFWTFSAQWFLLQIIMSSPPQAKK